MVSAASSLGEAADSCQPCHASIVQSYARTGMGRSFFPLSATTRIEDFSHRNRLQHEASRSDFRMEEREGRFYMRREANGYALEKEIHYVLGSGNHARSYVHRTEAGRLYTLPVSWYADPAKQGGGFWGMAPGFDRADHPHFRRRITYDCFFCHNGYPQLPAGADAADAVFQGALPQGIDCSRCHGDAARHLARPARGNILNPRSLTPQRQMEVCLQCHLETSSHPQPLFLRRTGRAVFSYQPEEPLADYMLHFDHADRAPFRDKFEVVSAPYRLMQSACYRKSNGKLTCLTCHNPHERAKPNDASCRTCHVKSHTTANCISCHMASRSPEDAPLTRFTDHRIAKRPETGPGRPLPPYTGPWRLFWPPQMKDATQYLALATAVFNGKPQSGLSELRQWARSQFPQLDAMRKALAQAPRDPILLTLLGEALSRAGNLTEAEGTLRAAIAADPDQPEPYVNLGALLARAGKYPEAADLFRQALTIHPSHPAATHNLRLLPPSRSNR